MSVNTDVTPSYNTDTQTPDVKQASKRGYHKQPLLCVIKSQKQAQYSLL